jgi:hypothetical protein
MTTRYFLSIYYAEYTHIYEKKEDKLQHSTKIAFCGIQKKAKKRPLLSTITHSITSIELSSKITFPRK